MQYLSCILMSVAGASLGSIFDGALLSPYISSKKRLYCLLNGLSYGILTYCHGMCLNGILTCLVASVLLLISIVDYHFYRIPNRFNFYLFSLGILYSIIEYRNWNEHVAGMFYVSSFLCILFLVSQGRFMGGGDVKMMASCGLIVGKELIFAGFYIGCVAAVLHYLFRIARGKKEGKIAMGPYLSIGVFITLLGGM